MQQLDDGRTARREANRTAVLDAVLELFAEGNPSPSPEQVAQRSGVSLRSVYRYVEDRDDLIRSAIERHHDLVEPLFSIDDLGRGALSSRIDRIIEARMTLHDAVAATWRASVSLAFSNDLLASRVERAHRLMRQQVAAHFAPELDAMPARKRGDVIDALDVLLALDTIARLRLELARSRPATSRVLRGAIEGLLR